MKGNQHKFRGKVNTTVPETLLLSSTYHYLQNLFLEATLSTYVYVKKTVDTTGSLHALMPFTSLDVIICKLQTSPLAKQLNALCQFIGQSPYFFTVHDIIVHS
jgi:hypothetical protein